MNATVQSSFVQFNDNIKLDINDKKPLVDKREMLIGEIRSYLEKKSILEKKNLILFDVYNQGSYAMDTGIKPWHDKDDYDIDVALLFRISKDDYSPNEVKKWVFDALDNKLFRTVEWKKPCIRVQYVEAGYPKFHVDFAVYSANNTNGFTYLAKGKPNSNSDQIFWEESEPKVLKEKINGLYTDAEEQKQFKRVIRYLKRWKDLEFDAVHGKPKGIAITALAYNLFRPKVKNIFTNQPEINDLQASLNFTEDIIRQFGWDDRIKVHLPVKPYNDLFELMTDAQCKTFKEKITSLKDILDKANKEIDPVEACKLLESEFGEDFPIPTKEETAQSRPKAVVGNFESA